VSDEVGLGVAPIDRVADGVTDGVGVAVAVGEEEGTGNQGPLTTHVLLYGPEHVTFETRNKDVGR
jgi:hypothetical protein